MRRMTGKQKDFLKFLDEVTRDYLRAGMGINAARLVLVTFKKNWTRETLADYRRSVTQ